MPTRSRIPLVLILDDDREDISLAASALHQLAVAHKIIIRVFDTVTDVLEAIPSEYCPAVCIIDYQLNDGEKGWSALKKIKHVCPTVYFIAMSGTENPEVLREFINNDGRRIIAKGMDGFDKCLRDYVEDGIELWKILWSVEEIVRKNFDNDV